MNRLMVHILVEEVGSGPGQPAQRSRQNHILAAISISNKSFRLARPGESPPATDVDPSDKPVLTTTPTRLLLRCRMRDTSAAAAHEGKPRPTPPDVGSLVLR
ncbi:hypothetical protein EYF80_030827 [Liparis tanakae]|uniref:Uncharacterized protein n=1 Tax=Liparis tanakae TaxID=230148 RepID=A0A4Z2H267_9TELE|nr:hypothetical protein EYF80_030827 [Liparis tanakae]